MKSEEQCVRDIVHSAMELSLVHGTFGTKCVALGMLELMAEWLSNNLEFSIENGDVLPDEYRELEAVQEAIIRLKSKQRYTDDRVSLAREIKATLDQAGWWVPEEWQGPDLITAVGRAVGLEKWNSECPYTDDGAHHMVNGECHICTQQK